MTKPKNKAGKLSAVLSLLSLSLLLMVAFSPVASAGTSDSTGPVGGATGGGGTDPYGIWRVNGGLLWYGLPGPGGTITTDLSPGGRTMTIPAGTTKGLYLTVGSKTGAKRTWLNWAWWSASSLGSKGPYEVTVSSPNGAYDVNNWQTGVANRGQLVDADLVKEALKTFYWNGTKGWYQKNSDSAVKMDAVWVSASPVTTTTTRDKIVKVVSKDGQVVRTDIDDTARTLSDLYWNGKETASTTHTSSPGVYSEDFDVSYVIWSITITRTYMTDGVTNWDINDSFSKTVKGTYSKSFGYDITPPTASTYTFVPFNVNTQSTSNISTVNTEYGSNLLTASSKPLEMSTANVQGQTNTKDISILDNNNANSFSVIFKNDQFGIPKTGTGGVNLTNYSSSYFSKYKNADGTYKTSVFSDPSINSTTGCTASSVLSQGGVAFQNHNESCSNDVAWTGPSLKAGVVTDKSNKTGIVVGNGSGEYLPGSYFGGTSTTANQQQNYYIKAITTQQVDLSSPSGKDFFEVAYEKAIFFAYGTKFNIDIDHINGFSSPSSITYGQYVGVSPKSITQPILEGHWVVQTVGGGYEG